MHFGPNTFTGEEWGTGKEAESLFNPKHLDCHQWCKAFKDAGFSGVIITAKHHDGFCLWPSKLSIHTVAQSPWKNGKGDVLKELSAACRDEGLKFGVYLSPWDRNHPAYGTPEYNAVFKGMLKEVLTHYGPVFEVWFDGANGEGPNGKKQVYDWPGFIATVRKYQPNACIFSDAGPDVRWVGNEGGHAGETNWDMIDKSKFVIGAADTAKLNSGNEDGPDWVPAECDVSIRPGWFWRASENDKVKSVQQLLDIWYDSVGRGANLNLNVPPNSDGLISDEDVKRLKEFNDALTKEFAQEAPVTSAKYLTSSGSVLEEAHDLNSSEDSRYWHAPVGRTTADLQFQFSMPTTVDRMMITEPIQFGQRIRKFRVRALEGEAYKTLAQGTTVGNLRVLRFAPVKTQEIWLDIEDSRDTPALKEVRFFHAGN